ncbi:MAG TPA: helix-turn-helix domain-containing protein [Natronosporangium sp.]
MEDRWRAVAALVDRTRRALFDYVRRQGRPVSREEAAQAQGMSRGLAAFHLDKLVDVGLLRARYQAPTTQPRGRGRAPKVYESAEQQLAISIPERRYQLIAEILADAVDENPVDAAGTAHRMAHQRGLELSGELRAKPGRADLLRALAELGFEPEQDSAGEVLLHNCPFHALATRHRSLVCGLNLAFVRGLVDGLATGHQAELVPRPTACCVTLHRADHR